MVSPSPGPTLDIAVAAADNADTRSRPLIVNKEVTIKTVSYTHLTLPTKA